MRMKIATAGAVAWMAVSMATSYANSVGGNVTCAETGAPLPGVRMTVTGAGLASCTPFPPDGTEMTDASGAYIFYLGACVGPFNLCLDTSTLPPGTTLNGDSCVTITGDSSETINFSVNCQPTPCTGQIGDFVWLDTNGNGCQDAGEPGITNVEVDLYSGTCGAARTLVATTHTDTTGHYLFSGLCMGDYQVSIVSPVGLITTVPHVGCTNSSLPPDRNQLDSKCGCTAGTACFVCVTLSTANPVNLNVDCGYVPPPSPNCATIVAVQGSPIAPVTLTGTGGCGSPYTFTASGLPNGLTMSSGGTISGTPTVSGTFSYTVTVTDNCGNQGSINCSVTVSPPTPPPVAPGDTATIGFWHNKNGQALINSLNGGSTSTNLGTWLAGNYGCLFGNLNGKPNSVVAAQFMTYFNVTGAKTYAQIMGGALAAYVTSSTLAGGTTAAGYGFTVSASGTGAKTYNVGSNGTAIGLVNNTSYTVAQLLAAANANCSGGMILPAAFNALNNIFDGINSSGDIK